MNVTISLKEIVGMVLVIGCVLFIGACWIAEKLPSNNWFRKFMEKVVGIK